MKIRDQSIRSAIVGNAKSKASPVCGFEIGKASTVAPVAKTDIF